MRKWQIATRAACDKAEKSSVDAAYCISQGLACDGVASCAAFNALSVALFVALFKASRGALLSTVLIKNILYKKFFICKLWEVRWRIRVVEVGGEQSIRAIDMPLLKPFFCIKTGIRGVLSR